MTDKLICPFCGHEILVHYDREIAACDNNDCPGNDWMKIEMWKQIIAWKQSATVLQKKLDKAMDALQELARSDIDGQTEKICQRALKEIEYIKE